MCVRRTAVRRVTGMSLIARLRRGLRGADDVAHHGVGALALRNQHDDARGRGHGDQRADDGDAQRDALLLDGRGDARRGHMMHALRRRDASDMTGLAGMIDGTAIMRRFGRVDQIRQRIATLFRAGHAGRTGHASNRRQHGRTVRTNRSHIGDRRVGSIRRADHAACVRSRIRTLLQRDGTGRKHGRFVIAVRHAGRTSRTRRIGCTGGGRIGLVLGFAVIRRRANASHVLQFLTGSAQHVFVDLR